MMLGLCPIVCIHVGLRTLIGRIRRAADLIVLQADRVADLVRDAELEQLAHQRVGEGNRARARIDLRRLREVPVLHQLDEVVEDPRRAVEDLTGARIAARCGPTEFSTVDGSQRTIVWRMSSGDQSGSFAGTSPGDDAVLEARRLERRLPVENRLANPRLPLLRRVRIDVVDDRLLRIAEIALAPIRALETPARDELASRFATCSLRAEVDRAHGEESDALVGAARAHRLLGQPHDAPVRDDALRRPRAAGDRRRTAAVRRGAGVPVCVASISTLSGNATRARRTTASRRSRGARESPRSPARSS